MHRRISSVTGSNIVITLPNTPAIREALIQLGGHGVDDNAAFWEETAEDAAFAGNAEHTPVQCVERAEAYRTVNEAILAALGVGGPIPSF